ncbi:MAG: DUF4190 domain-containing protein [Thermoleophilia bacterium]
MPGAVEHLTRQPLLSAGLGLGVISALIAMFAPGGVIASGPGSAFAAGDVEVELPGGVIVVFIIAVLLLAAALSIPQLWAKIAGLGLLCGLATTEGLMVIIGRSSDRFLEESDLSLGRAGAVLAIAFGVAVVGMILALVGSRALATPPRVPVGPDGQALTGPQTSGHATASMVLGICAVLAIPAAALAIGFANLAFGQIALSNGHRTGRGMAVAGLVLGIVWLSLWGLFMTVGIFVSSPSSSG